MRLEAVKSVAKHVILAVALIVTAPLWILSQLQWFLFRSHSLFQAISALLSLFPGKSGSYLRVAFHKVALRHCASDCFIGFGTFFSSREAVLGKRVWIGAKCTVGKATIGDYTLIGSNVDIPSGQHQHIFSDPDKLICEQGGRYERVSIGRDCWIGNGSIVMADVGDRCIIGAGSVVTKPIEANSIAAGVPAKVISQRPTREVQSEKEATVRTGEGTGS